MGVTNCVTVIYFMGLNYVTLHSYECKSNAHAWPKTDEI